MKNIVSTIFFTLSDHAARQSGNLRRFRAGENGEGSQDVCAPAQTSGVKIIVSAIFFTLPQHAGARKCEGIVNEKFVKTISR